jgi:phosphoglycerol transferase
MNPVNSPNDQGASGGREAREPSAHHVGSLLESTLPYLIAVALCVLILASLFHPWKSNLRIPLDGEGDAYFYQMVTKNFVEGGHFYVNPWLGAPGQQELYDFPQPDWTHLMVWAVLRLFTHSYGLVLNSFFLLTFALSALTACYALRRFGVSGGFAVMGAVVFAFLPFHLLRSEYHLFFSTCYVVPLACLAAVWVATGHPLFVFEVPSDRPSRTPVTTDGVVALLSCVLIAWDNPYNAFFAATLLLIAGLLGTFRFGHRKAWFSAAILCAVLTTALVVELLPNILYFRTHGRTSAAQRVPVESETYALTMIQLLAPIYGHRVPVLAHWREFYDSHAILVNENKTASIGAIGAIGFFISLASLFRRRCSAILYSLGILNLWAVLLGTMGGFGAIFAFVVSPQIRGYNRISAFIGFYSIAAFVWALDRGLRSRFHRPRLVGLVIIPGLLLVAGVLDEIPRHPIPPIPAIEHRFEEQQAFVMQIENAVPPHSMILQLPYMSFPEHWPINRMTDYDPLAGYLHSRSLRWSYGAVKGRDIDHWLASVSAQPTDQLVASVKAAGFSGIYIDRFGYDDHAFALEAQLRALSGSGPITDASGRYLFFRL